MTGVDELLGNEKVKFSSFIFDIVFKDSKAENYQLIQVSDFYSGLIRNTLEKAMENPLYKICHLCYSKFTKEQKTNKKGAKWQPLCRNIYSKHNPRILYPEFYAILDKLYKNDYDIFFDNIIIYPIIDKLKYRFFICGGK